MIAPSRWLVHLATRAKRISLASLKLMLSLIAICVASQSTVFAQQIQVGIDFNTVLPRGGFSENITNNGYGIGGQFLVGLGRLPMHIGADAGFVVYGSDTRREPLSTTIPELELKVRTTNNIVLTHFLLRAQPRSGTVRPYLDGLIGFKYLFTDTTITDDDGEEELASTTNLSDTTFSYGFGGGVQVKLADIGRNGDISFDTKVRYLRGSRAEYLKKGSIRMDNGGVFFDVFTSRTDVVTVQVGVTFRF